MPLINRVALRDKANFCFANYAKKPASISAIQSIFTQAARNHKGVVVLESHHGCYAYAEMMADMMKTWAQEGVTRFYPEMVPAAKQTELDLWQVDGNDEKITDYFDSLHFGWSKRMWQYYWKMLQAAKDNDIRIVGIDKPDIQSKYGARFAAPFKNMFFESEIEKDRKTCNDDEKFVVFCGQDHGTDFGGALKGIHQRLDVPRIILAQGPHSIARHPFERHASHTVSLPALSNQDVLGKDINIRNVPVKWPIS